MKKAITVIFIIIALIAVGVVIAISVCVPIANRVNDTSLPAAALSYWQSMIMDDVLLKQVVMPGSHDAGTKDMPWYSKTQSRDIANQLACGTRYFDLRIKMKGGEAKIYHGPAVSSSLKDILNAVNGFLNENNGEVVILDFQKFASDEAKSATLQLLDECLAGKVVENDTELEDLDFIDTLKIGDARGKCLIFWGSNDGTAFQNHIFLRNDNGGGRLQGCLQSYYTQKWNWYYSSEKYIDKALPAYIDMYKDFGKGLFVLQGQLTDGALVAGPRYREGGHEKNMNAYVASLAESESLQYINIIMRDFVSPNKNGYALMLNVAKGIVKEDAVQLFEQILYATGVK